MTTKLLIYLVIAFVGLVVYVIAGRILSYYLINPRRAGIFKNFLIGPGWLVTKENREDLLNSEDWKLAAIHPILSTFWLIFIIILFFYWLIQLIIWFGKAMLWIGKIILWIGKMIFGDGIAKKIVGEK